MDLVILPLNYRPISLTSCCCKVAERLLAHHIYEYLQQNNLLSHRQFGFRLGHSAEDQVLLTYGKIIADVDRGFIVDAIYLDYSKAFDVLNHSILMDKLVSLGFCTQILRWIESFLCGCIMQVSVGGSDSSPREVLSGVPQGSVLGPLLFLIYVNSLCTDLDCDWYAYADDLKLFASRSRSDSANGAGDLQRDLDRLCEISSSWNLRLNSTKCVVMRFGCRPAYESGEDSGYRLNGVMMPLVRSHRDLGVLVDPSLRFHTHVASVVQRANALINQTLRYTVCRSPRFMVTLFVSHIRPIIEYCSSVWNMGFLGDSRKLEALQRRWTREVAGMESLSYEDRLVRLKLFSISGIYLRNDLVKIWKNFSSSC